MIKFTDGRVQLLYTYRIEETGACLGYSLISNHAFLDGNKRIGVQVMVTFLGVHWSAAMRNYWLGFWNIVYRSIAEMILLKGCCSAH